MAEDSARDLLFGLLALQNGLIDQSRLVAAFQAWTLDKTRPLADHLAARGDLGPEERAGVEAMVALHLKKHGGDAARGLAAVPVGRSTREGLTRVADAASLATLARLPAETDGPGDAERTATYSVETAAGDGQRFRVLRPHARGGLGAVFVALDAELNREVAVKRILDEHADDERSRRRFLLEAEVTGNLEHPGIVPVYGLGTYADGRPYYAMRFIKGDNLKQAVARFHAGVGDARDRALELRRLLRRFLDVCNAVDYAHSRGVLHRDLKPANVIIGKHGETLVVDWGLAKPLGRPGAGDGEASLVTPSGGTAETLSGSMLGTPGYMSPEQAAGDGDGPGARSDVYSLGATLYCLLTGKAPFQGDAGDVIARVQRGDFPPPRALDRALEAVCLKAMATKPGDRYESCRALADDVERWAADEPVSAYREPWPTRAARWGRRHRPAVAGLLALVLASAVAAPLLAWLYRREARALDAAGVARRAEAQARRVAEANLYLNSVALANREVGLRAFDRAERLLNQAPESLRGWEWRYLDRQGRGDLLRLGPFGSTVGAVALSPDGARVVACDWDGRVRLHATGDGREAWSIPLSGPVQAAFSPDGRRVAVAGGDGVAVLDAATGRVALRLHQGAAGVNQVAFDPAGARLATAGDDGTARVWDAATGAEVARFAGSGSSWTPGRARGRPW